MIIKIISNIGNLSDYVLHDDETSVIEKGMNFAVAPTSILIERILCSIEDAVSTLPENEVEEM